MSFKDSGLTCKNQTDYLTALRNFIDFENESTVYSLSYSERKKIRKLFNISSKQKTQKLPIFVHKMLKESDDKDNDDNDDKDNDDKDNDDKDNDKDNDNDNDNDNDDENENAISSVPEIFNFHESAAIRQGFNWTAQRQISFLRTIILYEKIFPWKLSLAERNCRHLIIGSVSRFIGRLID